MLKRLYWGLGVLMLIICTAFVFMTIRNRAEIREMENESADAKAFEKQQTDGHSHGDHSHEKPVAQADAPPPTVQPVQVKQPAKPTHTGSLTYHEELLKTNPAKALRLQTEERGHWAAKWVPPFPPDDTEAQAYARNQYLTHYYESIGDFNNPENIKAQEACLSMLDTLMTYPFGPRRYDLLKLTWPSLREGSALHTDSTPSDYFPNYHTDRGLELLLPYYKHILGEEEVQRKLDEIRNRRGK